MNKKHIILITLIVFICTVIVAQASWWNNLFNKNQTSEQLLSGSTLFPQYGGTGKNQATAGDVGKYLKVSDNSPFEYSFDTPASGGWDSLDDISLTKGYFVVGNDAGLAQATSSIFVSSTGNVGVGLTAPASRLSVLAGAADGAGTSAMGIGFQYDSVWTKAGIYADGSTGYGGILHFATNPGGQNHTVTPNMTILANGNVGIGTTNPKTKLQVGTGNTAADTAIAKFNTSDTNVAALELSNWDGAATSFGPRIHFDNSGVGTWYIGSSDGANNFDIATTWGTPFLRIQSNGNVGIGTTSPGSLLSLGNTGNNTINISATATSTFGSGLNIRTGCFAINGVCVGAGGGSGTVTSIDVSGGTTGLTFSGGPITTAGTITMAGTLGVGYGGTGLTSYTLGDILYANTTSTLAGTSTANLKTTLGLNLVENTALSTWAGTSNITTLGNVTTGTWQALIYNNANPTIDALGKFAINTTAASSSLRYHDGITERALYPEQENAFSFASSTLSYMGAYGTTGTTTILLANYSRPITLFKFYCKTDKGTAWLGFGDGTASTTQANCSTSGVEITPTTNNTWVMRENFNIEIGRQSGTPSNITVTATIRRDAD